MENVVTNPQVRPPIRVFIAEDNDDLRGALKAFVDFEPDLQCVGTTDNAADVWTQASRMRANVIVLDMELGEASGLAVLRERPVDVRTPVLILSGHDHPPLVEKALATGAAGYFLKSGDMDELLAGIRRHAAPSAG